MRDQLAFTVSAILLALLFVFVAVLAGLLFTFGPPEFTRVPPPRVGGIIEGTTTGRVDLALAEDGIDVLREDTFTSSVPVSAGSALATVPEKGILMGGRMSGELPMLCPQAGPEIRAQAAFSRPALCKVDVSPSSVTFHLSRDEQKPSTGKREDTH